MYIIVYKIWYKIAITICMISLSPDTNCFVALELPPSRRFVSAMKFIVLIALVLVGVEVCIICFFRFVHVLLI